MNPDPRTVSDAQTTPVGVRTRRIAEQQQAMARQGVAFAPQGVPMVKAPDAASPNPAGGAALRGMPQLSGAVDRTGFPVIDWNDVTAKLGFDPRKIDPRRLTPEQRVRLRRFQFVVDSVKRTAGAAGVRRP